jgi:hypothetical protein
MSDHYERIMRIQEKIDKEPKRKGYKNWKEFLDDIVPLQPETQETDAIHVIKASPEGATKSKSLPEVKPEAPLENEKRGLMYEARSQIETHGLEIPSKPKIKEDFKIFVLPEVKIDDMAEDVPGIINLTDVLENDTIAVRRFEDYYFVERKPVVLQYHADMLPKYMDRVVRRKLFGDMEFKIGDYKSPEHFQETYARQAHLECARELLSVNGNSEEEVFDLLLALEIDDISRSEISQLRKEVKEFKYPSKREFAKGRYALTHGISGTQTFSKFEEEQRKSLAEYDEQRQIRLAKKEIKMKPTASQLLEGLYTIKGSDWKKVTRAMKRFFPDFTFRHCILPIEDKLNRISEFNKPEDAYDAYNIGAYGISKEKFLKIWNASSKPPLLKRIFGYS